MNKRVKTVIVVEDKNCYSGFYFCEIMETSAYYYMEGIRQLNKRSYRFWKTAVMLCFFISIPVLRVQASEQNQTNEMIEGMLEPAYNYVILVNKTQNIVQVKNQKEDGTEELVKTFVCSCGRKGHGTPAGTFKTSDYYEWRCLKDGSFGRYAVRFNKRILFHSVPYVSMKPDSLEWEQYNLLGETASLGCVRLAVADAKWIYENCRPGTKVIVYASEEEAVDKPEAVRIPEDNPFRGWDPTDENPDNPWREIQTQNVCPEADIS